MSRLLPRFVDSRFDDEQKLATILLEVGAEIREPISLAHALPVDRQALRGIPVVGAIGVGGTSPGTDPVGELLRRERRRS